MIRKFYEFNESKKSWYEIPIREYNNVLHGEELIEQAEEEFPYDFTYTDRILKLQVEFYETTREIFTDNEKLYLQKLLNKELYIEKYPELAGKIGSELSIRDKNSSTFIFKLKDEWFYLFNSSREINNGSDWNGSDWNGFKTSAYKCDQFDGLIDCIKNNIPITTT